jgi:hypothetical protein
MSELSFFKKHIIAIVIFIFSIIIGLIIYKDYGISWDDYLQRNTGLVSYNYVFHGNDSIKTYEHRVYGVGFTLPLVIIEKILNLKDSRDIYLMRHLVFHIFFLISAFVFYLLIYILYRNRFLGILGYLMLLSSPLIYAHSFFNPKDIPSLSMFIICFFLFETAFQKLKASYFLLFGIFTGWLINIRVMGVMFMLFVTVFMIIDQISNPDKKKIWRFYLIYIISAIATLIATWPYLWENPIGNFAESFSTFSKYPIVFDQLMFGEYTKSNALGWFYIPGWFLITTPIPIIAAGMAGITFTIINFTKTPVKFITDAFSRNQLIYFFCFFGTIAMVIILQSVLYNGWRHVFYIYPPFILLAIYGISCILKIGNDYLRKISFWSVIIIFVLNFANIGWFMIRNHPFQHLYFNNLVSHDEQYLRNNFDRDYFGTSFKQALEYVLKNDMYYKINVLVADPPGIDNALILKKEDRERLNYVSNIKDCDYYISIYHNHHPMGNLPASKNVFKSGLSTTKMVFNIKVQNSDIISVWKLR